MLLLNMYLEQADFMLELSSNHSSFIYSAYLSESQGKLELIPDDLGQEVG